MSTKLDWIVDRLQLCGFGGMFGGFLTPVERLLVGCEGFSLLVAFICAFLYLFSLFGMILVLVILRMQRMKLDRELKKTLKM